MNSHLNWSLSRINMEVTAYCYYYPEKEGSYGSMSCPTIYSNCDMVTTRPFCPGIWWWNRVQGFEFMPFSIILILIIRKHFKLLFFHCWFSLKIVRWGVSCATIAWVWKINSLTLLFDNYRDMHVTRYLAMGWNKEKLDSRLSQVQTQQKCIFYKFV